MTKREYTIKQIKEQSALLQNKDIDPDIRNLLMMKCDIGMGSTYFRAGCIRSLKKAVAALEKDIPKARFQTRCGKCDLWLNECDWGDEDFVLSESGQFNYCPRCGQLIDWTRDDCYDERSENEKSTLGGYI